METHIDWLSFTVTWGDGKIPVTGWKWEDVQWHIEQFLGESITSVLGGDGWETGNGRAPYAFSFRSPSRGLTVFWSGKVSHALIEISGAGMSYFRLQGQEIALLSVALGRVTRLDVATDIETDLDPFTFAEAREPGRTKSRGSYTSGSGQTEYVGARQSERFARVYRYKSPHPRAHLLRVEHELKGETARAAVAFILGNGLEALQADMGIRFGWNHPVWNPATQSEATFGLPARHRANSKTELWLRSQCAAAFKRLVKDGTITDPEQWLREVFLGKLDNET